MNQNEKWYFARGKESVGPMSLTDLRSALLRGEVKVGDLVYHEMLGQWTPAGKVAILQDAFTAAPPVAGPPLTIKTSQPRSNASAKNMAPPSGKMVMRSEFKPESAFPVMGEGAKYEPQKSELTKADSGKADSGKAEQPAGAGTLFDVSGDISEPDEVIEGEGEIAGGQMLIEKGTPLDFIPNLLRAGFPGMVANTIGKLFVVIGVWGQVACLALVILSLLLLLKSELSLMALIGMFTLPICLTLSVCYINFRLMPALNRLNTLGEGRIVSNALPDSLSVLFLGLGIGAVITIMVLGLEIKDITSTIIAMVISFLIFGYLAFCAVTAANPGALNMTVDGSLPPASEAAGAIQYLSKLFLRLALGLYSFVMTSIALGILFIDIRWIIGGQEATFLPIIAGLFMFLNWGVIAVGLIPLCAYLTFLGVQFFLDFAIKVVQNTRR